MILICDNLFIFVALRHREEEEGREKNLDEMEHGELGWFQCIACKIMGRVFSNLCSNIVFSCKRHVLRSRV